MNLHRDELAQILVVNHAKLKQATTDNHRKILMDEQTDIQKQRKEIRRKINLLKSGTPAEVVEKSKPQDEDIFLIPKALPDKIAKKRRLEKRRSASKKLIKDHGDNPIKLMHYNEKFEREDKAIDLLSKAIKKQKRVTSET